MSKLQEKSIKILNERYPYHNFNDEQDLELQQFTAEDMVEFAIYVVKVSLEKASEKAVAYKLAYPNNQSKAIVEKESITNPDNIIIL